MSNDLDDRAPARPINYPMMFGRTDDGRVIAADPAAGIMTVIGIEEPAAMRTLRLSRGLDNA